MQLEMSDVVAILNRIQVLEDKVSNLETRLNQFENVSNRLDRPPFPTEKISQKYKALAEYLYEKWNKKIQLSYAEIEEILDFPLPPTAYNLPQSYWANTQTHSYASSWLSIGYKAKVVGAEKIVFERNLY